MNDELMENLLREGESTSLDYKREQYPWAGASDEDKSELLKDVLAFANAWRHSDAYILIGVVEVTGRRANVVGIGHHIPDNDLQQFVNSKTNRPVLFSYKAFPFEGKQIGVITIPLQERPLFLTKGYGGLGKHTVYYRQGSSTAVASPDEIARMGTALAIERLLERQREDERRAKEDSRECVKAIARYGIWDTTGEELGVLIYNEGSTPVHLRSVTCHYKPGDGTEEAEISFDNMDHRETELLPPKHVAKFRSGWSKPDELMKVASLAKEDVWITISSYQGEICRVEGEEIIKVLNSPPTSQLG